MSLLPEQRFKKNLISFIEFTQEVLVELKTDDKVNINMEMISFTKGVLSKYDDRQLIETFITRSNQYWDRIMAKDRIFLLENVETIFKDIPVDKVLSIKQLFSKDKILISPEDEYVIWDYFKSLLKICIHYIHCSKNPKIIEQDGKFIKAYGNNNFSEIKVTRLAKKWEINLVWSNKNK